MRAYLIMDGQYGSCGKGLIAGKLALDREPDAIVCNFGPNAGHTFIHEGRKIMTQQLPTGIVQKKAEILIGPGAVIDPEILLEEIEKFSDLNVAPRLSIHPRAAVVTAADKAREREVMGSIGSTKKGTGAALSRKIAREPQEEPRIAEECHALRPYISMMPWEQLRQGKFKIVQIESAQGLELSLNHGTSYPTCTSRDITPEAILNDVGIPERYLRETIGVFRTFPIRVGHELCPDGEIIGHSGHVYSDMEELSWKDVAKIANIPDLTEKTTVTGKTRRVFSWSWEQFNYALDMLGPIVIFINFMNYLPKEEGQIFLGKLMAEASLKGSRVDFVGFGPAYENVKGLSDEN